MLNDAVKAHRVFVRDIAIVSDQSFEGLCEKKRQLSEVGTKGSLPEAIRPITEFMLPVPTSFAASAQGKKLPNKIASQTKALCASLFFMEQIKERFVTVKN